MVAAMKIALVSNADEVVAGLIHLLPLVILQGVHTSQAFSQDKLEELGDELDGVLHFLR